jgi:hypothetical protein
MQDELTKLLESIEAAPFGRKLTVRELISEGNPSEEIIVERRGLLKDAHQNGLIKDFTGQSKPEGSSDRENMECILTVKGIEYLNQIRIKNAIEKFNKSSDESSEKIIALTYAIYVFTVIVVAIPIFEKVQQIFPTNPISEISEIFIFIGGIVVIFLLYYRIKFERER